MCGIAGIFDPRQLPSQALIERMTRIMQHRGPDGEGYYLSGPVALGHRRLSIIDLAGGKQPISNEDGTVWITFNGEIYNFMEIRRELMAKGHRFATRSDTETIVHAYEEYGEKCVDRLHGMFAFAIWDQRAQKLFLVRDRLGKKPLYYTSQDNRFRFGSEIKAILQDDRFARQVDNKALVDYFTYGFVPFPATIFRDVQKLPPGHSMTVRFNGNGSLESKITRYWNYEYSVDASLSESDWCESLREKLQQAVNKRMISEVPLGAFLSGGVDSSAVVALMSQAQKGVPVKTFSIGFKEADFSELGYARKVSELFGTEHHEFVVEPDAIDVLPKLAWEFDEPFADSSAIPTYYVSKMAREHVTVVLSGDGGDETFAGYRRYRWAADLKKLDWIPLGLRRKLFGLPAAMLPAGTKGKGALLNYSKDDFERFVSLSIGSDAQFFNQLLCKGVVADIRGSYQGDLPDFSAMRRFYDECSSSDPLSKIQYVDTKVYLAEDILTKVDRMSMLCSLETRAPLLDHEVIEMAARMPSSLKLNNQEAKHILKKTFSGILPDEILYRKKMGFGVPLVHWFKDDLCDYTRDMLFSQKARERGLFDYDFIETMLQTHREKGRDLSPQIWSLLFFEQWALNWL